MVASGKTSPQCCDYVRRFMSTFGQRSSCRVGARRDFLPCRARRRYAFQFATGGSDRFGEYLGESVHVGGCTCR